MEAITLKDSSHATLRSQSYVYDKANFILEHTVGSNTTEYTYDAAGQLIREEKPWLSYDREYEYDGNGNRTLHTDGGLNPRRYLYAPGDKLTAIQQPDLLDWETIRSFTYDPDGRMVTDSQNTRSMTWDAEGRLTQITDSGGTVGHAYNGLNTRVSRSSGGTVTFSRDGVGVTSPLMRDSGGMAYTPGTSYRSGSTTTYMHSGLKSVEFESDGPTSLDLGDAAESDAWGNDINPRGFGSPFGYGGTFGYQSDATGYQLLGHRWYDPTIGRFLTRDPAKDGRNWYVYCGNEPVGRVDPDGLNWIYKFLDDAGRQITYFITEGGRGNARRAARRGGAGRKPIYHPKPRKGIKHYHSVDANGNLLPCHYASELDADAHNDWPDNWRDQATKTEKNFLQSMIAFLDPTPISTMIESQEDVHHGLDDLKSEGEQRIRNFQNQKAGFDLFE